MIQNNLTSRTFLDGSRSRSATFLDVVADGSRLRHDVPFPIFENVKNFGAVGRAKADTTAAFQACRSHDDMGSTNYQIFLGYEITRGRSKRVPCFNFGVSGCRASGVACDDRINGVFGMALIPDPLDLQYVVTLADHRRRDHQERNGHPSDGLFATVICH